MTSLCNEVMLIIGRVSSSQALIGLSEHLAVEDHVESYESLAAVTHFVIFLLQM